MGSFERVMRAVADAGIKVEVHPLPPNAHTAAATAQALGVDPDVVAKSLLFAGVRSGRTYLALVPGTAAADETALAAVAGEPLRRLDARAVRERTGFAIGGVSPFGHVHAPPVTVVDRRLRGASRLYVGSGTPKAVISLSGEALVRETDASVADIAA